MQARQDQVMKLMTNLNARFQEQGVHPEDKFFDRWESFNDVCVSYIATGKPAWDVIQELARGLFCEIVLSK